MFACLGGLPLARKLAAMLSQLSMHCSSSHLAPLLVRRSGSLLPPRARGCDGAGIDEIGKSYRVRFVGRCQGITLQTGCPDSCGFSMYQVSLTHWRFSGASSAGRRGVGLSRLLDHLFTIFSFSC